jgi:glycosyltransferase involved in cell wall biosynthesis
MSRTRPRVVYWNHSPTPYFVERFNAVMERGGLDFEAWFNERRESIRSWDVKEEEWAFPARYIPSRSLLGWSERVPVAELQSLRPDLLVQEYDRSHLTAGFLAGRVLARRTAFRVLPNFDSWSERTWWREAGKRFVFRAVDAAKVPGKDGRELAERYGLPASRIEHVTQSVDVERLAEGRGMSAALRAHRREELGLEGCVFIYTGRLWSGKGTDRLLDAYQALLASGRQVSLLLLGDGPDEERYRARAQTLERVVFAGFIQAEQIAGWYALADAMVFPTLGDPHGLVVEEAMVAGLPVICTTAAGDIAARLPHGEAGFIVTPNDSQALEGAMRALADDEPGRLQMGRRAAELAEARSHRRYAEEFEAFVTNTVARGPRRSPAATGARLAGSALVHLAGSHQAAPVIEPTRRLAGMPSETSPR